MSDSSRRLFRFKYNVYVGCRSSSFDIYSNRFDGYTRRQLKKQLKKRIGDHIGRKAGSIGNSYLLKGQTPDKSTNKGFLLGDNGGSISDKDSMQYVYDLITFTVVDSEDADKTEKVYYEVLDAINETVIELDMGVIFGSLSTSKTREFQLTVTEPKPPYEGDRFSSHDDQSLTSSIPESSYKDVDVVDEISSTGSVTDPVEATDEASDAEQVLDEYDIDTQVESLKEDYNDEAVEVRKPTESEVERIVDAIIERFEEMCDSEEQMYFENHPDFWEEASCSNCQSTDSDMYHISKQKMESIIMTQLKEGFGITDDEDSKRKQLSQHLSNFYVSNTGEVLFRPEEVISWIIDYIHYVEPYCEDCHTKIGGDGHIEVRKNSKTESLDPGKPSSYSNLDTVNTGEDTELQTGRLNDSIEFENDTESISIETDEVDDVSWTVYRSPKPSETEEIMRRIVDHLYSLGTRADISYKSQRDGIYRVIMKRGEFDGDNSLETFQCKDCGDSIDDEEKHHPIPLKLREAHMDIINTVDRSPQSNPILVNESENEYILSHQFLWRMESHIKNLDMVAFKCSDCSSPNDSSNSNEDQMYTQKTLSDVEATEVSKDDVRRYVLNYNPDGSRPKHRIHCPNCKSEKGKDDSIVCRLNGDGRYETPDGSQTPIIKPERIGIPSERTQSGNIGVCYDHVDKLIDMVWATDPQDQGEVEDELEKSLLMMFNRHN